MDWIKEILEKYVDAEGKFDIAAAIDEVKSEFPKNAITKEVFNQKNEDLKAANKLVDDLKSSNADIAELQTKIADYELDIAALKTERLQERKSFTLKEKLKEAGAKDIDYMIFKLGDVETDDDGNIVELENKIKELKETYNNQFNTEETATDDTFKDDKGFKVLDNGLEDGQQPNPEAQMTAEFEQALGIK